MRINFSARIQDITSQLVHMKIVEKLLDAIDQISDGVKEKKKVTLLTLKVKFQFKFNSLHPRPFSKGSGNQYQNLFVLAKSINEVLYPRQIGFYYLLGFPIKWGDICTRVLFLYSVQVLNCPLYEGTGQGVVTLYYQGKINA
jgi:hypothetical protein